MPSGKPILRAAVEAASAETAILLVAQVFVAVLTAIPFVLSPSTAARSFASASVIFPLDVIGLLLTVMPAAGAVMPTDVTVPLFVAAIVTVPALLDPPVDRLIPAPSINCTDPPELDSVTVWLVASDVLAIVCSSLVVEPSTSVLVTVKFG